MKSKVIHKLKLRKGCKYILFFDKSSGLEPYEANRLMEHLKKSGYGSQLGVVLEKVSGVKVIETRLNNARS